MIHSKTRSSVGSLLHSPPPWGLETWDVVLDLHMHCLRVCLRPHSAPQLAYGQVALRARPNPAQHCMSRLYSLM